MKTLFFLIFFSLSFTTFSQSNEKIDTNLVEFKAKLFTLSVYGLPHDSTNILEEISKQKVERLNIPKGGIIFFKIKFDQKYLKGTSRYIELLGSCNYYIAYNHQMVKFYRLGGWDLLDNIEL